MDITKLELEVCVVVNENGDYFKSLGNWVNDLNKAKIYPKLGQARGRVTRYISTYPNRPIPNIIIFSLSGAKFVNQTERITKLLEDRIAKLIARKLDDRVRHKTKLQREIYNLQQQLQNL